MSFALVCFAALAGIGFCALPDRCQDCNGAPNNHVHPVLRSSWTEPSPLSTIPDKFVSWSHYAESFRQPVLEEFRSALYQSVTPLLNRKVDSKEYTVKRSPESWRYPSDKLVAINDPKRTLVSGDVYLISHNPDDFGQPQFWDHCGRLCVSFYDDRASFAACHVYNFNCIAGEPVYITDAVGSASTTCHILKSLHMIEEQTYGV